MLDFVTGSNTYTRCLTEILSGAISMQPLVVLKGLDTLSQKSNDLCVCVCVCVCFEVCLCAGVLLWLLV